MTANTRPFIRRNGIETILTDFVPAANNTRWYRVAQSGWSPTDVIEVGVLTGAAGTNSLNSVAVIVEHNTPEPEPTNNSSVRVVTVNYAGNGGAQTVDLGVDEEPTVLFVVPKTNTSPVEPLWWWNTRLGAAAMTKSVTGFGRVWPSRGKLQVVHASSGNSYNVSGVSYTVIALFDPTSRFVLPFAVSKVANEDNYTHNLRDPQTGALATTFTPDFVFGGSAFSTTIDAIRASLYRGPGHLNDLTSTLATSQAADANRIQALSPGAVQFGTTVGGAGAGDFAFWAGRVDDGVSPTRLMAVTSYIGNGASSRNISLNLSGESPVLAFVVPTNNMWKIYRVTGDTGARYVQGGSTAANTITGMAADQITVGSSLNANGVTYDVWAITTGVVTPW